MNELQISQIQSKIYQIRGQRVMLDRDLATLYGVETPYLFGQNLSCNNFSFIFLKDKKVFTGGKNNRKTVAEILLCNILVKGC